MKANNTHDDLTGLLNRKKFQLDVEKEISSAKDGESLFSLVLTDVDFFKKLNDNYGHAIGDDALIKLARHFEKAIGDQGRVYRYGGEEFVIILKNAEKEKAFLIMENVRTTFPGNIETTIKGKKTLVDFTFSTGVATFSDDGMESREILRQADQALYRAKINGRNIVCLAKPEKMVTKTSYYTQSQLKRLSEHAKDQAVGEAVLLREALDDLLLKYK